MKKIFELLTAIERWLRIYCIQNKAIFTTEQAALYLDLSIDMIYFLTSKRLIAHYKPSGKLIYLRREDMDKWALCNPVQTRIQIEECFPALRSDNKRKKSKY